MVVIQPTRTPPTIYGPHRSDLTPWHDALLQFTLTVLGCNVSPPTSVPPSVKIYYNLPSALVRKQLHFRRMWVHTREYASAVADAFSALTIAEDRARTAGPRRILPAWYKTRPHQHQQATTVQAATHAGDAQRPVEAVAGSRPARRVGRTGTLVAREACRAHFSLRKPAGRPRAGTPLALRTGA